MSDLTQGIWTNWSGFQKAKPQQILQPVNIQELQSIVYEQQKIRVVGAGPSFTPLVCTDATLVSLDRISGVASFDVEHCQSNIYAGTRLYDLDQHLQQQRVQIH